MDPLSFVVGLAALAGTAGSAIAIALFAERSAQGQAPTGDPRRDAALALGLSQSSASNPDVLFGMVDGRPVHVVWQQVSDSWFATGVTTVMVGGLPRALRIGPRPDGDALRTVWTGDTRFDREVGAAGDREVVLAALTAAARERLLESAALPDEATVGVWHGAAQVRLRGLEVDVERLRAALERAASLAAAIDPTDAVQERLADNARNDPVPAVQWRNLRVLLRSFDGALSEVTARWACLQSDPRARLESARHLGDVEALRALLHDEGAGGARAEALSALTRLLDRDQVLPDLRLALHSAQHHLREVGLQLARRLAATELAEAVDAVVVSALDLPRPEWNRHRRTLLEAARTAARLGGPTSETTLLRLLEAPSNPIRLEAIRGLGKCGSVRAVEPLMRLQNRPYVAIRRACGAAITAIQARAVGAEAGALSLAAAEEHSGALSLAREEP